ncbi:MAG: hypothetical protein AAGM22_33750, partial [Acidobacteriota bacterium]
MRCFRNPRMWGRPVLISSLCLLAACAPAPEPALEFEGEWPQWRGAARDGHPADASVAWPAAGVREAWRPD